MTPPGATAAGTSQPRTTTVPDIPLRRPGTSTPDAIRDSAARAGRRYSPPGMRLLKRVREALARLPDGALSRHYNKIPGDGPASPSSHPAAPGHRRLPGDGTRDLEEATT